MAMGRKAPRGKRGGCPRGASIKVAGYTVTKMIQKKKKDGTKRKRKTKITYTVAPYCRKKAPKKRKPASGRKAVHKGRKAMHSKASKASANFVCQSKSTKRFTRRTANGQCRAGSKKIRI